MNAMGGRPAATSPTLTITSLVQWSAVLFFVFYVLSNTAAWYTSPILYYAKHLSVLLLAMVGILWFVMRGDAPARGRYVLFVIALFLLSLPYLVRFLLGGGIAELLVFVQYALFGAAVVALAASFDRSGAGVVRRTLLVILGATAAVALVTGLRDPNQLYNSYWGRPRLLLGFWHPKQLGTVLAPAALIMATSAVLRIRPRASWLGYFAVLVVLLLVDSRNMFLFSLIIAMAYLCATYASYYVLWLGIAAAVAGAAWAVDRYPLLVDIATSRRLSLWREGDYTILGTGTRFTEGAGSALSKFHIDNYYLEYVIENGVYAVVLMLVLVTVLGYILRYTPDRRWRRLKISVAIAFFFSCIFDAGMFSTGNLLNVAVWTYLLAGEFIFGRPAALAPMTDGRGRTARPLAGASV